DGEMQEAALRAAALGNRLAALVAEDAAAFERVSAAYKLPKEPADAAEARTRAVAEALLGAARVPLQTALAAAEVAELAALVAEKGNSNAVTDAGVAALLAEAACKGAVYNVRVNVVAMADRAPAEPLLAESAELLARASRASQVAQSAVERAVALPT
ncbi:MAG: cyclodeaminase/cyclohydrolase family protein, partial [Gemmatirosa sp.]|nr:cyclodeaminase/cyclohydrolase family protein [Gemmatirosa sp.]